MALTWAKTVSGLDVLPTVSEAGFDAAELPVEFLMEADEDGFQTQMRALRDTGLSFPVFSGLLPDRVVVTEQGFNIYVWSEYLKRALERVAAVGGRRVVWANGRSRVLPVEGEVGEAKRQVMQFLYMVSEVAEAHGIQVLVEPLDPRRTNFINTMTELEAFLAPLGRPNLSAAVSLRDLAAIELAPSDFERHAGLISHVYLEDPAVAAGPRQAPRPDDGADYRPVLHALGRIGYAGVITLPENADEASLRYCRALLTD